MAKNFVNNETIIEADDCNRWEKRTEKVPVLEQEVIKKIYKPAADGTAGQILVSEGGDVTQWKNATEIGAVTKAAKIDAIGMADAPAADETYTKANIQKIVNLVNKDKEIINNILEVLKTAGIMANA